MWLLTPFGFFSIVRKLGDSDLTIRARAANDLDRLRSTYMPELSPTVAHSGTDYPFRATMPASGFGLGLMAIADDLDYPNFKDAVSQCQGHARATVYAKVWQDLFALTRVDASDADATETLATACGGTVIDDDGRILLIEPRSHFDGYLWTFPKGRPAALETPEETVVREVREETGVTAVCRRPIPGRYRGGTTVSRYFLLKPDRLSVRHVPNNEVASMLWATYEQAQERLLETTNAVGRTRDLAVLDRAFQVWWQTRMDDARGTRSQC